MGFFFHFVDKGYPASYCFNNVVSIFVEILFISLFEPPEYFFN